jgi:3-hydroxyacyl-CoA dehydrogenase/enoyl-CoA hydratase/3-hydroxybutyryl-CoA epimerase/enoyl-CoA isomerase
VRRSVRPQLDFDGFGKVDLLVEAIVENIGIKKRVLADVESLLGEQAVIASNTSSLSIAEMASVLKRPQNFVGMHFFNPVPLMPLVEVIRGPATDAAAAATAAAYAATMGKTPIIVQDCPGFLVNRILIPYFIGFVRLVRDGADFRRIDRVMEDFGWPMGPAQLADVIGMDTLAHVIDVIAHGYGARMTVDVSNVVALLVAEGRLGQKSGLGFYRYQPDAKGRPRKVEDATVQALVQRVQDVQTNQFSDEEIVDRLMLPMLLEAARCVDERVVESAVEVDTGLVLGIGFPRHLGGILHWADRIGLAELMRRCERFESVAPLYAPSAALRERAVS